MSYKVKKGLIYSNKGIPAGQRWFADNRLGIQFDETGVTRVEYRNPEQKSGNPMVFLKGLHDGFRYFLDDQDITLKAEYEDTVIWPFGLESRWKYQSCIFTHSIYTVNDSIVVKFVTPDNIPEGLRFKLEFNEPFSFIPASQSNFLLGEMGAGRIWEKWSFNQKQQVLEGRYWEKQEKGEKDEADIRDYAVEHGDECDTAVLNVLIGADFELRHVQRSGKHILYTDELQRNKEYHFVTAFIPGAKSPYRKFKEKLKNLEKDIEEQYKRYRRVMNISPVLESPYKELNHFISLSPMYHEALKVTETPGAVRAKTSNYWVWGWDGLTSNAATLYWGDTAFIKDVLRFYEKTAHPERGIAHAFRNDMSVASICELPSQSMYITLLQHYYNATNDLDEVRERYGFCRMIYQKILTREVGDTGFCEATSLFPDFPVYMKETGHDISAFNNTVLYCASRSMEYLATLMGDTGTAQESKRICNRMESNFVKLFFDEEKGFIVNSIDSQTLEKRACYSSDAIKWENEYCGELFEDISGQCMGFFDRHFVSRAGIRPVPVWDSAFDGDANQLHSWWPVMGEYYMKLVNQNNRLDLLQQWIGWVSYWTKRLTIPEGIPCYIDTDEPEHDRWDTLCGTWQAYSVRGWYQAVLHGVVGVEIDAGGITFFPHEGKEMMLKNFHYLNKLLDIEMAGSGRFIRSIEIEGQSIRGTNKLPIDWIKNSRRKHIKIKVCRVKENPYKGYIKYANGLELWEYICDNNRIGVKVKGAGTSRIKLEVEKQPEVLIDGEKSRVLYDKTLKMATIEVEMPSYEEKLLEILF